LAASYKFLDSAQPYTSITNLEICIDSDYDRLSLDLEKTRFQRLSDLVVHTPVDLPVRHSVALIAFLVAHPTIQAFSLPDCQNLPEIAPGPRHFLPKLASLSVTPELFMSLAPIWDGIHNLSCLSIKRAFPFSYHNRVNFTLQNPPNQNIFRNLKRCCFSTRRDDFDHIFQCLKSAVDVKWWTILFPLHDNHRFSVRHFPDIITSIVSGSNAPYPPNGSNK